MFTLPLLNSSSRQLLKNVKVGLVVVLLTAVTNTLYTTSLSLILLLLLVTDFGRCISDILVFAVNVSFSISSSANVVLLLPPKPNLVVTNTSSFILK